MAPWAELVMPTTAACLPAYMPTCLHTYLHTGDSNSERGQGGLKMGYCKTTGLVVVPVVWGKMLLLIQSI